MFCYRLLEGKTGAGKKRLAVYPLTARRVAAAPGPYGADELRRTWSERIGRAWA
jgi:hypothetical protein